MIDIEPLAGAARPERACAPTISEPIDAKRPQRKPLMRGGDKEVCVSTSEREKLLAFLFDRDDKQVLNVKFFRGNSEVLTANELCRVAREVISDTWSRLDSLEDVLPVVAET